MESFIKLSNNVFVTNPVSELATFSGDYTGYPLYTQKRLGNREGSFGIGQVHGQEPGYTIYYLVRRADTDTHAKIIREINRIHTLKGLRLVAGLIEDESKSVTQDFKNENDIIVLLGDDKGYLGGSEYLYLVHGRKKGNPQIDIEFEKALQGACLEAIKAGIISSAHDASEGGLAVCLTESCITNGKQLIGAVVELDNVGGEARLDEILFGEAPSKIVVSLKEKNLKKLEKIAKKYSIPLFKLGTVQGRRLIIKKKGRQLIDVPVDMLSDTWRNAIPSKVKTEASQNDIYFKINEYINTHWD